MNIENKVIMQKIGLSKYKIDLNIEKIYLISFALSISLVDESKFDFSFLKITKISENIIHIPLIYDNKDSLKLEVILKEIKEKFDDSIENIYIELEHNETKKRVGVLLPVALGNKIVCSGIIILNNEIELFNDINAHIQKAYSNAVEYNNRILAKHEKMEG